MAGLDLNKIEQTLRQAAEKIKADKANEERMRQQRNEEDRQRIMAGISKDLQSALQPFLNAVQENNKLSAEELKRIISESISIPAPSFDSDAMKKAIADGFTLLKPAQINLPKINMPDIKMPELNDIKGWIGIMGYDRGLLDNPLPVQLRDKDGNPIDLLQALASISGGGAVGGAVKINNNSNEPIPVTITSGSGATSASALVDSSGVQYSGSNPLPVSATINQTPADQTTDSIAVRQVSGFVDSVNVVGFSSTVGTNILNSDGSTIDPRDRNWTITEQLPVVQVSGHSWSTFITGFNTSVAASLVDSSGIQYSGSNPLPVTLVSNSVASVGSALLDSSGVQYSGSNPLPITGTVGVSGITNSVAANLVDSSGVGYSGSNPFPVNLVSQSLASSASALVDSSGVQYSGSNPVPITGTVVVSSITNSAAAALIDSSGIQYSGSNPLPVTLISGGITSTLSVGDSAARTADNGGNPVKVGGIARQTNPTAYSDGNRAEISLDDLGRQLMRPIQARDLIATAYATLNSNGETTLLAGIASTLLDPIMVKFANTSTAAVTVDLRCGTGGNVSDTFTVPASSTQGFSLNVPYPESEVAQAWTIKFNSTAMGTDVSGTTVYVTGQFSKEV